jgi:hypothetical protein
VNDAFKYFAFISYNAKDLGWGKELQKKLEHYRLPSTLCKERGWKRTPIKPVFFAPTDIQPGGLSEELQERLKASQHLIVICSPNSAKSEWVGREIEFFYNLGRANNIHFFIVEGTPHSSNPETECFNPVIDKLGLPEILGANIHEKIYRWPWLNRERAYAQLISKLLGVEFDTIWQRHKRQLVQKAFAWTVGSVAVLCALLFVWRANQPVEVSLRLSEASVHNDNLPPLKDAIISMTLDNETKSDTLHKLDDNLVFNNIPHHFLNKPVYIMVSCRDFLNLDTTVLLTPTLTLNLFRDPHAYGDVRFRFWNPNEETTAPNEKVSIAGIETISDEEGYVTLFIPMEKQQNGYRVMASIPLANDTLTMPCGGYEMIEIR